MVGIPDCITHANFRNNRLRGLALRGLNFAIPINFCRRSYNTISLLCDCEISGNSDANCKERQTEIRLNLAKWSEVSRVYRPTKHITGHFGDGFCGSNDPTNSVKALKEVVFLRIGFSPTRSTSPCSKFGDNGSQYEIVNNSSKTQLQSAEKLRRIIVVFFTKLPNKKYIKFSCHCI